jgi:hypothetical protein
MQTETLAFEQMHGQVVQHYLGEYIAIHNGELTMAN